MSFYLIDDLEQGSSEWLLWRQGVIGASDAATIMGENPWASSARLMEEKLGMRKPFSGNAATREGHLLENFARKELTKKFKKKLRPSIVQDASHPFLAASLDALDSNNSLIYEIKCGAKAYEKISLSGKIPNYYIAQLQHMLMVTEMDYLIYAAYRPNEPLITLEVFRNEAYIRELRKKEKAFIKDLEAQGHKVQYEFRGYQVGKIKAKNNVAKRTTPKKKAPSWIMKDGIAMFWDGSRFLEGEEPGLYELGGMNHYWDGEKWDLPEEVGFYLLNGEERFWDGNSWE